MHDPTVRAPHAEEPFTATQPRQKNIRTVHLYVLALLSAVLLNLCFPIIGPAPRWCTWFAFFGAAPLLIALLGGPVDRRHYLRESWLLGWCFGTAWYAVNCYWIYRTMNVYGKLSWQSSALVLFLFSSVMALANAALGLLLGFLRRNGSSIAITLLGAPPLWVAIDLWTQYVFRVPWDQLGYSQIGNFLLLRLVPWTGVHGITFILLDVNALLAAGALLRNRRRPLIALGAAITVVLCFGRLVNPPPAPTQATAVLLQENLDVRQNSSWAGAIRDPTPGQSRPEWDVITARFVHASQQPCTSYIAGMPDTAASLVTPSCSPQEISLIVWPEAPTPFREDSPRFRSLMRTLTQTTRAPAIVGNVARDRGSYHFDLYNAASVFEPNGGLVGRYAKIHLVPWGEYIPYKQIFGFVHGLTRNAGRFSHGWMRPLFTLHGHRYGIFICYESMFADEVRQFVKNGAEVLVNISDDGWYGDTSAPWQHLNMARMRAIENRRWLLCDTNTGITTAIDPWGRLTQSAVPHIFTSLAAHYGFRNYLTFYTLHGDVFAFLCLVVSLGVLARACISRFLNTHPLEQNQSSRTGRECAGWLHALC